MYLNRNCSYYTERVLAVWAFRIEIALSELEFLVVLIVLTEIGTYTTTRITSTVLCLLCLSAGLSVCAACLLAYLLFDQNEVLRK